MAFDACVRSAPGLIMHADLSVLVRTAATGSSLTTHKRVLFIGDHIIPVIDGRVKSLVTYREEDRLTEVQAQNGGAIASQTVLAQRSTASVVASIASHARFRGEDVTCVVPPSRSVRLRMTLEIPAQLLM